MMWLNEPPAWHLTGDTLGVTTGAKTDFWRETHYGFVRDDGHFYYREVSGDFSAEVTFDASFEHLYDQAGLMLRLSETHWLKAGVEYSDGARLLSTVVTRGRSDWSVMRPTGQSGSVTLRLTRRGGAVLVQAAAEGAAYELLRLTDFPDSSPLKVGPMCCSPERAALEVTFRNFRVGPPEGQLHAEADG